MLLINHLYGSQKVLPLVWLLCLLLPCHSFCETEEDTLGLFTAWQEQQIVVSSNVFKTAPLEIIRNSSYVDIPEIKNMYVITPESPEIPRMTHQNDDPSLYRNDP